MTEGKPNDRPSFDFREAVRFWEPRRAWYNGALVAIVLGWVLYTWPHFRPAVTLPGMAKMCALALLANLFYCAAYVAEFFVQPLMTSERRRYVRQVLWILGMLFAIVLANYWIADEIYPDVSEGGAAVLNMSRADPGTMASNMNFPAPLAVLGFLGAGGGLFVALAGILIFSFARKPKFARMAAIAIGLGASVYVALLLGFSAGSRNSVLAVGQEKYFCEIDCHLAYSVTDVKTQAGTDTTEYLIALRTRFDETTISPHRPKDAPLMPSPRRVELVDGAGHSYGPVSSTGTALMTPIRPGETHLTQLTFRVPKDSAGLRLLVKTVPAWPDLLVIGDENSVGHGKTYFAL